MRPDEHDRSMAAARRQPSLLRLTAAALLTAAAALALNAGVYAASRAYLDLPDDVSVLTPGAIVLSTVLGVALAAAGLATLPRLTPRPVGVFRRLAVVVGILSLLGPVAAAVGLVSDVPEVSGEIFVTLALMNLLTTATIILLLPPTAAMRD